MILSIETPTKIVIREDFAKEYLLEHIDCLDDVRRINRNISIDYERNGLNDYLGYIEKLKYIRDVSDLQHLAISMPKMIDAIRWASREALRNKAEMDSASSTLAELTKVIDTKVEENDNLKYALATERDNKFAVESRLDYFLDSVKLFNGIDLDMSRVFSTDTHNYTKVLYFKEITRVQYMDSFIQYLQEILKVVHHMPVRLCVIEPHFANGKVDQYNLPVHYELTDKDVVGGDILMLGYQDKLFESIMKNTSRIPVLVVLDRAGYHIPHIKSSAGNVEYFYMASDPNDIRVSTPLSRVISYSKDTLNIPYIENYEKLDANQRIGKYSNTNIMKSIVKLVERG